MINSQLLQVDPRWLRLKSIIHSLWPAEHDHTCKVEQGIAVGHKRQSNGKWSQARLDVPLPKHGLGVSENHLIKLQLREHLRKQALIVEMRIKCYTTFGRQVQQHTKATVMLSRGELESKCLITWRPIPRKRKINHNGVWLSPDTGFCIENFQNMYYV